MNEEEPALVQHDPHAGRSGHELAEPPAKHPSLFEPSTIAMCILTSGLGAIIGVELLSRVGVTPNTSVLGAIIAITVARIPLAVLGGFRNPIRQNLVQTAISGATFGGANAIFLPMGVVWLLGRPDLAPTMMAGAVLGLLISATVIYRVFDSAIFPARGPWPDGIATAECLVAGDKGGRRAVLLGCGGGLGAAGSFVGIPMDIVGICWIGNIYALIMFAVGLLSAGYAPMLTGLDVNKLFVPHGVMIGAGFVGLLQIIRLIASRPGANAESLECTVTTGQFRNRVGAGFIMLVATAAAMALAAGFATHMRPATLLGFVALCSIAAMITQLIVGASAMHAGWFPAFAMALVFLIVGILLGFPPTPLAFLVGFTASVGPAFADMAFDLKAGWLLRGSGRYPELERQGRRQQYFAELLGFAVAALFVGVFHARYFLQDAFPPAARVYVSTIEAGLDSGVATQLMLWAVPGAIIQGLGGISRQMGILLATGLLIANPIAGWAALVALLLRAALIHRYGGQMQNRLYILAAGLIAGSALWNFGTSTVETIVGKRDA